MKLFASNKTISIAPMLDYTDRHFRYLARLMSSRVRLYTEMVTTKAILHGDAHRHLAYNQAEHPVALQLGGSCPKELAACAGFAQDYGYDEINLNIGCPSERVQSGSFGACLMREPELVADGVAAIKAVTNIPVTIKTRIGVDDQDDYAFLHHFISTTLQAGCREYIIHARKALLKGLSPKENRTIPPLRYDIAQRVQNDFPELRFIVNGGIQTIDEVASHLEHHDGVMIGRQFYKDPYWLASIDTHFDPRRWPISRKALFHRYFSYMQTELNKGTPLKVMSRHLMNLFNGKPGAKAWRQEVANASRLRDLDIEKFQFVQAVKQRVAALPENA